jgi:hypothetical protein
MQEYARDEIAGVQQQLAQLEAALKLKLLPRDPLDDKNIMLEVRAGECRAAGGQGRAGQGGWAAAGLGRSCARRHGSWEGAAAAAAAHGACAGRAGGASPVPRALDPGRGEQAVCTWSTDRLETGSTSTAWQGGHGLPRPRCCHRCRRRAVQRPGAAHAPKQENAAACAAASEAGAHDMPGTPVRLRM